MKARSVTATLAVACAGIACTPDLNWRDVRPDQSGLAVLLPCKPAGHARRLTLAGVAVEMSLFACSAGGATYAVGFADVEQPQLVGRALDELVAAAARNIGSSGSHTVAPLRVEGMTPQPQAGRQAFAGQLADGQRVEEQVAVFARGTRVYQATAVGTRLGAEATETFFGSLRLLP
jgi:hypothetical protein